MLFLCYRGNADGRSLSRSPARGARPRPLPGRGARQPEFLSTHPAPGSRIENLEELMPAALEVYRARGGGTG